MPFYVIKKNVDLNILPRCRPVEEIFEENTLGDLHSNVIKLIYTLVEIGLLVDLSQEDYSLLIKHADLSDPDTASFNLNIFSNLVANMEFSPSPIKLRLLGDELCDRGVCDWFVLIVLAKLSKSKIDFEILLSNHSMDFIECFETKSHFDKPFKIMEKLQRRSANNLQILINMGIVNREEIDSLLSEHYLPRLKLLSYSQHEDRIFIYTHAPVGIETIKQLLKDIYKEVFNEEIKGDLFTQIDICNQLFQDFFVKKNTIHQLYKFDSFKKLLWAREELSESDLPETIECVEGTKKSCLVHGHDSSNGANKVITHRHVNLDSSLGKKCPSGLYKLLGYRKEALTKQYRSITNINDCVHIERPKTPLFFTPKAKPFRIILRLTPDHFIYDYFFRHLDKQNKNERYIFEILEGLPGLEFFLLKDGMFNYEHKVIMLRIFNQFKASAIYKPSEWDAKMIDFCGANKPLVEPVEHLDDLQTPTIDPSTDNEDDEKQFARIIF